MTILQEMAGAYQRLQQLDRAIQIYSRLEEESPNDSVLKTRIATLMFDQGMYNEARKRFDSLANAATDPSKRFDYLVRSVDAQLALGQRNEAVRQLESLADEIRSDSWRADDILRRIEEAFLRDGDVDSLTAYYKSLLVKTPNRISVAIRLAKLQSQFEDYESAISTLESLVERLPNELTSRHMLCQLLNQTHNYSDAIKHARILTESAPGNSEYVQQLGQLLLRETGIRQKEHVAEAVQLWSKYAQNNSSDSDHLMRVAGWFRDAGLANEAVDLYELAMNQSPADWFIRKQFGETLHKMGQTNKALEVWQGMTNQPGHSAQDLVDLAAILHQFGYTSEATTIMQRANEVSPKFDTIIQLADYLVEDNRIPEAVEKLYQARVLASSKSELRRSTDNLVELLVKHQMLNQEIVVLEEQVADMAEASVEQLTLLVAFHAAAGHRTSAMDISHQTIELHPQSIRALEQSASLARNYGMLSIAADRYATLADLDRRGQFDHLKSQINLLVQIGNQESAVAAVQILEERNPGNPAVYRFTSDLHFQLGNVEQALVSLRNAIRLDDSDVESRMTIAQLLIDQFETDSAIDILWEAFERTNTTDRQKSIVRTLAGLYQRQGNIDRLTSDLHTHQSVDSGRRMNPQLLAVVHEFTGNSTLARQILSNAVENDRKDVDLLKELVLLAEESRDYTAAAALQNRINIVEPSSEGLRRQITYLVRVSDTTESREATILEQFVQFSETDQLQVLDFLIDNQQEQTAVEICLRLRELKRSNWATEIRLAICTTRSEQYEIASTAIRNVLTHPEIEQLARKTIEESIQDANTTKQPFTRTVSQYIEHTASLLGMESGSDPLHRQMQGLDMSEPVNARLVAVITRALLNVQQKNTEQLIADIRAHTSETRMDNFVNDWDLFTTVSALHHIGQATEGDIADTTLTLFRPSDAHSGFACLESVYSQALFEEMNPRQRPVRGTSPRPLDSAIVLRLVEAYECVSEHQSEWLSEHHHVAVIRECDLASEVEKADQLLQQLATSDAWSSRWLAAVSALSYRADADAFADRVEGIDWSEVGASYGMEKRGKLMESWSRLISANKSTNDSELRLNLIDRFVEFTTNELTQSMAFGDVLSRPSDWSNVREVRVFASDGVYHLRRFGGIPADGVLSDAHLGVLATAWQTFRSNGETERLKSFLESQAQTSTDLQQFVTYLALAQIYAFEADGQNVQLNLRNAAQSQPDAVAVKFHLARIDGKSRQFRDVLQILNSINTNDPDTRIRKELIALETGLEIGDEDTIQSASTFLAGVQLTADQQLRINRAQQRMGLTIRKPSADTNGGHGSTTDSASTQVDRMRVFHDAGQHHRAVEAARELLYSGLTKPLSSTDRNQAIAILASANQLDRFIIELKKRLQVSVGSVYAMELLEICLIKTGNQEEATRIRERISSMQPDNPKNLLALAKQMDQKGQTDLACDRFLDAIRLDVTSFASDYYQIIRVFKSQRRLPELSDAILQSDMSQLAPNAFAVQELIEQQMRDTSDAGLNSGRRLYARAWNQLPNIRQNLLSNIQDKGVWHLPEMFDSLLDRCLPNSSQHVHANSWIGLNGATDIQNDGRLVGDLNRLVDSARKQSRLNELRGKVSTARKQFPDWQAGPLLSAVLSAFERQTSDAVRQFETTFEDDSLTESLPGEVAWLCASVLLTDDLRPVHPELTPWVNRLIQIASERTKPRPGLPSLLSQHPSRLFAEIQLGSGQGNAVRLTVFKALRINHDIPSESLAHKPIGVMDLIVAAELLTRAGFPIDAADLLYRNPLSELRQKHNITKLTDDMESRWNAALTLSVSSISLNSILVHVTNHTTSHQSETLVIPFLLRSKSDQTLPGQIESPIAKAIDSSSDENLKKRLLNELVSQLDSDSEPNVSLLVLTALLAQNINDNDLLNRVVSRLGNQAQQKMTDSRTRFSESDVAVWLIARKLNPKDGQIVIHQVQQLREFATKAVHQTGDRDLALALVKEHGDLAMSTGDIELASRLRQLLIDVVLMK